MCQGIYSQYNSPFLSAKVYTVPQFISAFTLTKFMGNTLFKVKLKLCESTIVQHRFI